MTNFLSSIFSRTPRISGHRVEHTKTVEQTLGASFNYIGSVRASSAFCKKLLKWCAHEDSTENIIFLLMCEKYRKNPSSALFDHMYNEFIGPNASRSMNISGKTALAITLTWKLGDPGSSGIVFDDAAGDARLNLSDSIGRLKNASFETAFTLTEPRKKTEFDSAMAYLKTQGINLL